MNSTAPSRRIRIAASLASIAAIGALLVAAPQAAIAGPTVNTTTFNYSTSTQSFTVPAGITSLSVTITGGEGGNGGADATPAPPAGGYRGVVTGTLSVTPGQTLTVAVGSGGATGASQVNANQANAAIAGSNPLGSYNGGTGGKAGANGYSGFGGAGGAASVLRVNGSDVVAAGGGGNGGSGQFASTRGRTATSTYAGRTDSTTTNGQLGLNANDVCSATNCSNNDGGGGGGGGGGAQGGAQGALEFGAGSSNEWFGYAGSVGQNSIASLSGLTASYQYYSDNAANGSIVISYTTGSPAAPTAVTGTAGNGSVSLLWSAPADPGQTAISDYYVQYSSNGGSTWSSPVDMGSTATSGVVTGLSNGTSYIFQVAAVNSIGTGTWSASSPSITPQGPPSAPTITSVVPQDGALSISLTAPSSGATVTSYDYQLNGGSWVNVASTSTTITIPGLVNGTSYSVAVRAQSTVGAGTASSPASGTPQAVPGAPTITSISAGYRALTIAFTPGFTGGGTISSYQYTLDGGTTWTTASGTSSPITISGLSDGTTYSVKLRAVNGSGSGVASATATATTPAVPGAPTVSSVTAGDGIARVAFTPGTTGGSPIDHYEYRLGSTGTWTTASSSSSPITITGLTNGTPVDIRIRAVNSVGTGTPSSSTTVTPATVPGAPTIVGNTVAGSDSTLSASFTAPSSDGGSAIVRYQYSTDSGATWRDRTDGGTTASPLVITTLSSDGTTTLSNGSTYYVELRAVNGVGAGTASAIASGLVATYPSSPTVSTVTAQPQALQVTFTAGSNGGSAITGYQYTVDGGTTWTTTGTLGTTFTLSGLTNGTSYPVKVRAINSLGAGIPSSPVSGTPVDLPGRPTISSVVRSNQTLTASVTLTDNGGSAVTSWQYSTDGGTTWATASGTTSPLVITTLSTDGTTRLSNGTGYALAVRAVTAIGTGQASATTTVAPAAAPAAPSIALTPGNASISVAFTLGIDGGSPVSLIEYSLDGGTSWTSTGTLASPFSITGLTNGTAYGVQMRADNAIGNGTPSLTASTTPRTVPGAPTSVSAVSNSASADVSWAAPASTGGATVTSYTAAAYAASSGGSAISSCTSSSRACSITGLTNGTSYYIGVTASNVAGTGVESSPRVLVTPLARPAAPTLTSLAAGDGSINVTFTAGSAGDRSITGYQYSLDGGTTWLAATGTSSPILVTGLTNGTSYSIKLRAISSAGVGDTSNSLSATPYTYPSAPDPNSIIANGGNGQIIVSWAAANLNGGTLLNYTATAFSALTSGSTVTTCTTTTLSCTLTGLTNGTTYYISLQTQNTSNMYSVRTSPRVPGTPSLTPGAPGAPVAVAGNAQATVTWTAPTSTGASAITGYIIRCSVNGGSYTQCATPGASATSATITGLTNGSSYTFDVSPVNSYGTGIGSNASNSVTPLAAGLTPTFGSVTSTTTGFTSSIPNYDGAFSYSATATNGATVTLSGSTVTVTGLSNGASSTITVTATRSGYSTTSATVTGAALLTGVTPTFSTSSPTTDGFTFTITNYDSSASYSVSATNSATVSRSGATVTVSGLSLGGSSAVTVTVSKTGYTTATAVASGAALALGTAPTFSNLVSTGTGFHFEIANYNASLNYAFSATGGATASRSGAVVTVTGLANGASSDVTVVASNPGVSIAAATETGAALLAGTAPTVSTVTQTASGFSVTITNYDGTAGYSLSSTAGTAVITTVGSDHVITVTGLNPGQSADVTIVNTKAGYVTTQTTVTATALLTGITPLFSAPTRTADGYTFTITNFDSAGSYAVSATSGSATAVGNLVTVAALAPSASATVTVTVSHTGYLDASSTQTATALAVGVVPVLNSVAPTIDGLTFTIANYDATLVYTTVVSPTGVAVIHSDGTVTVSGVASSTAATVTVRATNPGVSTAAASIGATTLFSTTTPTLSAGTPLAGGYRFTITNYDASLAYTFAESHNGTVSRSGATVTVSGLGAGVFSETTVAAQATGGAASSATAGATSFPSANAPVVGVVTRTLDGFTFELQLDNTANYSVISDAGSVTLVRTTVTVTGLAPGATTVVHVTASVPSSIDATVDVAGTAIATGTAPTFGTPVRADGGFTVTIANYSSSASYALSVSAGTVTRNGDTLTVSGLAAGATASVTVTATRGGYTAVSSSITSAALPAAAPAPAPSSAPSTPVTTPSVPTVTSGQVPTETDAGGSNAGSATGSSGRSGSGTTTRPSTAGAGAINSGGVPADSRVTTAGKSVAVEGPDNLRLTVSAQKDGKSQPLAAGVVVVDAQGKLWVTVEGLSPESIVTMWSLARSTQLASSRTDASGATGQMIALPSDLKPGVHTLVAQGVDAAGKPVTLQLGFRVLDATAASAVTPSSKHQDTADWWGTLLLLGAVVTVAIWLLLAWRRRRREDGQDDLVSNVQSDGPGQAERGANERENTLV